MSGMTGPLAPLFAQLATVLERAGRSDSTLGWDSPGGYCPCCEMADDCHTDDCEISLALAALSAIERHVQDMEKALGCDHHETAWTFIEYEGESWNACQDCGLLEKWAGGERFAQRVDPAALPASETPQAAAREKEEE